MPVSAFPEPWLASPVFVAAFTGPVKLSISDGKTNWEVKRHNFPKLLKPIDRLKGQTHVRCDPCAACKGPRKRTRRRLLMWERLSNEQLLTS
ncbi:hypothetical protein TNCV_3630671 [Trichonephila clavipes]|nr:hypothetical protein TNCV_3630671 [Trichonephila clavipes]